MIGLLLENVAVRPGAVCVHKSLSLHLPFQKGSKSYPVVKRNVILGFSREPSGLFCEYLG